MMSKLMIVFCIAVIVKMIAPVNLKPVANKDSMNPLLPRDWPDSNAQSNQSTSLLSLTLVLKTATSRSSGDFNGDGLRDFIQGFPEACTLGRTFNGEVRVLLGKGVSFSEAQLTTSTTGMFINFLIYVTFN